MKSIIPILCLIPFFAQAQTGNAAGQKEKTLNIIPQINSLTLGKDVLPLNETIVINYNNKKLKAVANLLASDILCLHGIKAKVQYNKKAKKGELMMSLSSALKSADYTISVNDAIFIKAKDVDAMHCASVSLVQAIDSSDAKKICIPQMKISDKADRDFRALMIDIKNHWHSLDDLKQFVRLCRFYKVNYLMLHTGEDQWLGAICKQTAKLSAAERIKHRLYTMEEMDELIRFAGEQGVYLLPHNESTPHFAGMKKALNEDFVEGDDYAGFMDELIGGGAYTGDFDDERYWALMKEATERAIDQFRVAYPGQILPYYHVGPCHGEGGMNSATAAQVVKIIVDKSPKTKMLIWNGIGANDTNLSPYKKNIVIDYYLQWGGSHVYEYLEQGWDLINACVSPLYIVGMRAERQDQIYNDWNYFRGGSGSFANGVHDYIKNVQWFDFKDKGKQKQMIGGMMSTWEIKTEDHMPQLLPRLPAFAENAWHYRPWPYPEARYDDFKGRYDALAPKVMQFMSPPITPDVVVNAAATEAVYEDSIHLTWIPKNNNALNYNIYRSTSADAPSAKLIASVKGLEYKDKDVKEGQSYHYWVESSNYFGQSDKVGPVKGSTGQDKAPALAYEGFDYASTDELLSASSVTTSSAFGWASPWSVTKLDPESKYSLVDGLSYGKLPVSGKALKFEHHVEENGNEIILQRQIAQHVGQAGTSTWVSFLLKPEKASSGFFFLQMAHSLYTMGEDHRKIVQTKSEDEQTYFVVYQFINTDGKDRVYAWVNPDLNAEAQLNNADKYFDDCDLGPIANGQNEKLSQVLLNHLCNKKGAYIIDEIRVGSSWLDVIGGKDIQPPTPQPMSWHLPPSVMKSSPTSVDMTCTDAHDDSGVQYYFKEISGNPGGKDSGWIDKNYYINKGLKAGYSYEYQVKARDKSAQHNETDYSNPQKVKVVGD